MHAPFLAMLDIGLGSLALAVHYAIDTWVSFWVLGVAMAIEAWIVARFAWPRSVVHESPNG